MKANELMVGDWIQLNDSYYQIRELKKNGVIKLYDVTKYGEHDIELTTDWIENDIKPIPLTYDILESNFGPSEKTLNVHPHYLSNPKKSKFMIGVQLKPQPDCHKLLEVYNYDTNRGVKYECSRLDDMERPFYVHELQHLMTFCEIKDEIILE